jgi:acyl-CoA synthetase (AMP-forming)/AMP-acid ligase II
MNIFESIFISKDNIAFIYNDESYSYNWLDSHIHNYLQILQNHNIQNGSIVSLLTDYSPYAIAMFLALIKHKAIIMPLSKAVDSEYNEYKKIVKPNFEISFSAQNEIQIKTTGLSHQHKILNDLQDTKNPGLIIMSSGTSGKSKAIVHNLNPLLLKLKRTQKRLNVLTFLTFDHIGGINSFLNAIYSGNCLTIPNYKDPVSIGNCISQNKVDVLITSPSFLNLMFMKDVFNNFDLTHLSQINYGSEIMPTALLDKLALQLPSTKLYQSYGLSELGIIKTKTPNKNDSLIKISDPDVKYRIVNNQLEIKSSSSMLGYLNAPSPFTHDGWFMTGDQVQQKGDGLHILGRSSDIINIGGEKVFPIEIENVLLQLDEIEDALVCSEKNAILGNIIVAKIKSNNNYDKKDFIKKVRSFCKSKLSLFKIPQRFVVVSEIQYGHRYKKNRNLK